MFEKMFKGMFVLTVWGFILIAVAALLPDSAWVNFPEKLLPVRDFLAEKNIISSQFRPENLQNNELAKKNTGTQPLAGAPQTDMSAPTAPQNTPRQSFTGVSQTSQASQSSHSSQNAAAEDSKLAIPPFPTGAGNAALDKNRVSLAQSSQPESQAASQDTIGKSTDSLPGSNVPGSNVPGTANVTTPKADTVASSSENGTKRNVNDTLPELSFDSTSLLSSTSPVSASPVTTSPGQSLSIDTSILSTPGAAPSQTSATGLPSPVAGITNPAEQAKPIGNATLPDAGVISTTSATNTNETSFPSLNNANLSNSGTIASAPSNPSNATPSAASPTAVSPTVTNPVVANATAASNPVPQPVTTSPAGVSPAPIAPETPVVPLVSPSQELVQALVLSRNPNETKTAFFKLNQLLERHSDTYSAEELEQLHKALDRLAFTVFYDPKQHVLEPEYVTSAGETLASIAGTYKITPEHLAALNGLSGPNMSLMPGTKLKVVRGPVSANVSMSKKELLLLYDGLYAGRFKMGYAVNAKALRGILSVTRKITSPQYIGPLENGTQGEIAGGDPRNPLGPFWIELNNGLGLQGTNHPEFVGNETAQQGGLIFSNKDITHLNILLPQGANVYLKD